MITEIEDYFIKGCGRCDRFETPACSAALWRDGLIELRRIALEAGLRETVKWGQTTYMHAGRNIAIIGAFQGYFNLSFFNEALMKDPEGVMENQGANAQHASMIRFKNAEEVSEKEEIIRSYLSEAMGYAEKGIKPPKVERVIELPDELVEALDADPELAEAFHALTPGRQKSYVFNLNGAKKSETRIARIAKFRDKIIAGKGALDR